MSEGVAHRRLLFLALALATAARLPAANFDYEITAGGAHSDNVTRAAEDEQAENIASAGFRFSFDQATRKLTADLVGNFEYQKYLDDTFDPRVIGNFVGNVEIAFIPERFTWVFADNFGQVLGDPLLPATPLNDENINFFATGPDVVFALGERNRLRLGARYLNTDYEESPYDSSTALAEIGIGRNLTSVNALSLNARLQQVDYDTDIFGGDYDQNDVFLRYEADGARTKLRADVGLTDLERDIGLDSDSEMLRLEAVRQITTASNLSLLAGREFANSGSAFAALQGDSPITLDPTVGRQTPQPFLRDHATLAWEFQKRVTTFTLRASLEDQDYEFNNELDQKFDNYGAFFRRDLSAASNVQVDIARVRGEFSQGGARYTDTNGGVTFYWGMTRTLTLGLSYRYSDRNGDAITGDYTENRVWLSLGFGKGAPRIEMLQPAFTGEAQRN